MKDRARVPCLADLSAHRVIAVAELVERNDVEFGRIDFPRFIQRPFFRGRVHDPADNAVETVRGHDFGELAFHHHREFVDDGSIHGRRFDGMIAGAGEFVRHLVSGGDPEEIGNVHVRLVRQ